uniref:DNA polymerase delta subunit 3 n=1 Tax=Timspurckia oligopyrenoides TaxID=708627 RepID=A0A7S0ZDQ9_9RHOD|mmetsp:Transcript_13831/g.24792  ORF Transcript_13831/g.24792 Transcript_13831/m.24792 type:complete len:507 (+) Transcript_13831:61-1581(+)
MVENSEEIGNYVNGLIQSGRSVTFREISSYFDIGCERSQWILYELARDKVHPMNVHIIWSVLLEGKQSMDSEMVKHMLCVSEKTNEIPDLSKWTENGWRLKHKCVYGLAPSNSPFLGNPSLLLSSDVLRFSSLSKPGIDRLSVIKPVEKDFDFSKDVNLDVESVKKSDLKVKENQEKSDGNEKVQNKQFSNVVQPRNIPQKTPKDEVPSKNVEVSKVIGKKTKPEKKNLSSFLNEVTKKSNVSAKSNTKTDEKNGKQKKKQDLVEPEPFADSESDGGDADEDKENGGHESGCEDVEMDVVLGVAEEEEESEARGEEFDEAEVVEQANEPENKPSKKRRLVRADLSDDESAGIPLDADLEDEDEIERRKLREKKKKGSLSMNPLEEKSVLMKKSTGKAELPNELKHARKRKGFQSFTDSSGYMVSRVVWELLDDDGNIIAICDEQMQKIEEDDNEEKKRKERINQARRNLPQNKSNPQSNSQMKKNTKASGPRKVQPGILSFFKKKE